MAGTFGCDHSAHLDMNNPEYIGMDKDTLIFSSEASHDFVKTDVSRWGIGAFKSAYLPYMDPFSVLKENTTYMKPTEGGSVITLYETLSYEWIEASRIDKNLLRVSVAENTSDTIRSIVIELSGDVMVYDALLVVRQYPKGQE
jgi:hypothetical protein